MGAGARCVSRNSQHSPEQPIPSKPGPKHLRWDLQESQCHQTMMGSALGCCEGPLEGTAIFRDKEDTRPSIMQSLEPWSMDQ